MNATVIDPAVVARAARASADYLAAPEFGAWRASTPLARRAAAAASLAACDQWQLDAHHWADRVDDIAGRTAEPPAWCKGRLGKVAERLVADGADPEAVVRAARFVGRFADLYVNEYISWREEAVPFHPLYEEPFELDAMVGAVMHAVRMHAEEGTPFAQLIEALGFAAWENERWLLDPDDGSANYWYMR